jgi:hypothetical protein
VPTTRQVQQEGKNTPLTNSQKLTKKKRKNGKQLRPKCKEKKQRKNNLATPIQTKLGFNNPFVVKTDSRRLIHTQPPLPRPQLDHLHYL